MLSSSPFKAAVGYTTLSVAFAYITITDFLAHVNATLLAIDIAFTGIVTLCAIGYWKEHQIRNNNKNESR